VFESIPGGKTRRSYGKAKGDKRTLTSRGGKEKNPEGQEPEKKDRLKVAVREKRRGLAAGCPGIKKKKKWTCGLA